MAVTFMTGFEGGHTAVDGFSLFGTPAVSAVQVRTGARALRCNKASGVNCAVDRTSLTAGWLHFAYYFVALPSVTTNIAKSPASQRLYLTSTGKLRSGGAFAADSTATLAAGTWYWIGFRGIAGTFNGPWVQVDGVDDCIVNAVGTVDGDINLGSALAEATTLDSYYDDVILDDTGFIASSKVGLLVPTADSSVGAGWTLGSGGTTGLWDAVNNEPPTAVADAGTTAQIRNAASNTNSYDATMTTYAAAGVASGDTVLAVQPIVSTAAPVVTSAKLGTVGVASNPTIANVALGAGGTAGAFWSGVAGGTWPTGWKSSFGTVAASPSVAVGTAPVMRVTQSTASTRIAMVALMGINVAWTPGVPPPGPRVSPYPQILAH